MITHLNQLKDIEKARSIGIDKYYEEQHVKVDILNYFLENYDNGYLDVFFCLAVNLVEIDDLNHVFKQADEMRGEMDIFEKSDCLKKLLNDCASKRGLALKLRNGNW